MSGFFFYFFFVRGLSFLVYYKSKRGSENMKNMVKKENSKVHSVLCKCTGNVQEAWGPERKKNDHFAIWIHEDWMTESTIDNQIRAEIEGGYYPAGKSGY